jgi:hypothetical protein
MNENLKEDRCIEHGCDSTKEIRKLSWGEYLTPKKAHQIFRGPFCKTHLATETKLLNKALQRKINKDCFYCNEKFITEEELKKIRERQEGHGFGKGGCYGRGNRNEAEEIRN